MQPFADVLERTSSYAGCIIVGDINVQIDDVTDKHTARLLALLDTFGLADHIRHPTHRLGHQLDVLISRVNQTAPAIRVDSPLLSDHSLIVASINVVTKQHTAAVSILRRRWKSFNFDLFASDLEQSRPVIDPPSDVADLFECYDETLRQPVDKHAPLHQVKVRSRPSAPWFDAECCSTKATTRKLEKAYRRIRSKQTEDAWRAHFQKQRVPFQQKFIGHWSTIIDSCQGDAKSLWSKLKFLLEPNTRVV
jgi:hypothetical protein